MEVSEKDLLLGYAGVNDRGSILMGKDTVADGYQHGRQIGIFTHIHQDHIENFTQAAHTCSRIYMSPPTFDLLTALYDEGYYGVSPSTYFEGRHIHRLDFDTPLRPHKNERNPPNEIQYADQITLMQARHILGSAQVVVDTDDGKRIVYSSDFAHPDTKPIKCDVLILDSTHGSPEFDAPVDSVSLENRLEDLVDESIKSGKSVTVRAHIGRLQYLMHVLTDKFGSVPFLTNDKNMRLASLYTQYNMKIKDIVNSGTPDGMDMLEGLGAFIDFRTVTEKRSPAEIDKKSAIFNVGGKFLGRKTTIRQRPDDPWTYDLEMGDHGQYEGIIDYVSKCGPKLVITDSYRSKKCPELAKSISTELGIEARPQPRETV